MVLFHATATIAGIFTCISPDLGLEGCVSRLQQVQPKIFFSDTHTIYKGKMVSMTSKVEGILERLSPKPQVFVVPLNGNKEIEFPTLDSFLEKADDRDELRFERVPFNHPLMICYSSGTTGAPKVSLLIP